MAGSSSRFAASLQDEGTVIDEFNCWRRLGRDRPGTCEEKDIIYRIFVTLFVLLGWALMTFTQVRAIEQRLAGAWAGLLSVTLLGLAAGVALLIWWLNWPKTVVTLGLMLMLLIAAAAVAFHGVRLRRTHESGNELRK